jgi:O-methyltransferase
MLKRLARSVRKAAGSAGVYVTRQRRDHVYIAEPHAWGMQRRVGIHDEPQFLGLADTVKSAGRCLLGYDRLYVLWQAARNAAPVPGAVGEVGSFRGGSAYFLASAFKAIDGRERRMHIFDTFEGHPTTVDMSRETFHKPGLFAETSYDEVKQYLSPFKELQIHKAEFSVGAAKLQEPVFAFAHIDVDIYQTSLDALEYFGSRMPVGGVIVVDDYTAPKCPGVAQAVDEYRAAHPGWQLWHLRTEQAVLVKVAP